MADELVDVAPPRASYSVRIVEPPPRPEPDYPARRTGSSAGGAEVLNWAQNAVLGRTSAVSAPATEAEVQALVAAATGRIRMIGSRMSAGRMLEASADGDVLLDLSQLRGLLGATDDTATFAGATPLQEVYEVLTAMGRMPTAAPGVIAEQTLAGALATGTHGQGLRQSSIGDAATSIRMVLADGTAADFDRDHPWFPAVQLGLGVLGVVTAVTLRTEPSLVYTCAKSAVSADHLADDLVRWSTGHVVSKAWWFPDEDQVHVWTAREATDDEARAWRENGRQLVERAETSDAMNATVETTLATMRDDTRIVDADGKPFRTVARFRDFSDVTGDVYQVFCRGIATPQINVEIGVPLARVAEVVEAVRTWHATTRPRMHYPVILRCTGPSAAWLSPSAAEDTCFFGFVVYYAEDGSLSQEGTSFLRAVERVLAAHGGRPHWGKYFDAALYDWPALYPRWAAFREVREALDPRHVFDNAFTTALLGPDGADRAEER